MNRNWLAFIVPTFAALVASQSWFRSGTVIASGDLAPPLVPGTEYLSHWNHLFTGEGVGGPSYEIVKLPFYELLRLLEFLGIGVEVGQRIWLSALFALTAAAVVFFVLMLTADPLTAAIAGILSTFNPYRLQAGVDPVPMVALIVACLMGGLILRTARSHDARSGVVPFTLVSLGSAFVFVNPPHLVLVTAWVFTSLILAWAIEGGRGFAASLSMLVRATPLILLVNAWWLAPAALTIFDGTFSGQFAASSWRDWAWTHRRASLGNVLGLNTTWAWRDAAYYPYATMLERPPLVAVKFLIPALAILGASFALRRHMRVAVVLVSVGVVGAVFAKGLHEPLGDINRWLYDTLPGYGLFRDPSKILMLLMITFVTLGGIALARLFRIGGRLRAIALPVALFCLLSIVAYAHPIFTGMIVPDERPLLPSAHVRVPLAWQRTSEFLNRQPAEGKVLVLPGADFYQLPTTWGYYGVPFTRWMIRRPVLEPLPGDYFRPPGSVANIVSSVERGLIERRSSEVIVGLRALGVRYVLLRHDIDPSFPGRAIADANDLAVELDRVPGLELIQRFGPLEIHRLESEDVGVAEPIGFGGHAEWVPAALSILTPRSALVTPAPLVEAESPRHIASPGGRLRVLRLDDQHVRNVEVHRSGSGFEVRLSDALQVSVGGLPLPPRPPVTFDFDEVPLPALVSVSGMPFVVDDLTSSWRRIGTVAISGKIVVEARRRAHIASIRFPSDPHVSDCNKYDDRSIEQVGISAAIVAGDEGRTLRLAATDHAACLALPVDPFQPGSSYRIQLEYRTIEGGPARACLWQSGVGRCAPLSPLDASPGWHRLDAPVEVGPRVSGLRLFLYADGAAGRRTVIEYRRPRVERSSPVHLMLMTPPRSPDLPSFEYRRVGPGAFRVRINGATDPFLLIVKEAFASGWRLEVEGRPMAAPHVTVNGFSNGWLISREGTYELSLEYGPERVARVARWTSLTVVVALLALGLITRAYRRRMRFTGGKRGTEEGSTLAAGPASEVKRPSRNRS